MRVLLVWLLLSLPGLVCALEYHGENTLYQDSVWQGEVLIDGILTIAQGTTLEIRPGTRVRFVRIDTNHDGIGESEIFAQGRIVARGTAAEPILFTSAETDPHPGDWGALNMMMSEEEGNLIEYCRIEYGYRGFHAHFSQARLSHAQMRHNMRGAQFQESTVTIEDSAFVDNFNGLQFRDGKVVLRNSRVSGNHWGVRAVFVELRMEGCRIENNRTNGVSLRDSRFELRRNRIADNRRGVYLQRSQGRLSDNRISTNHEHGIYLEDSIAEVEQNLILGNGRSAVKILNSGGRLENNRIEKSGEFAFYNAGRDDFSVGGNWYGEDLPQLMDGRLREGLGLLRLAPALTHKPEVAPF